MGRQTRLAFVNLHLPSALMPCPNAWLLLLLLSTKPVKEVTASQRLSSFMWCSHAKLVLPSDAPVHIFVAWCAGTALSFLAESYRRYLA